MSEYQLQEVQKNQILELITISKLNPLDFKWVTQFKTTGKNKKVETLFYTNDRYYCCFEFDEYGRKIISYYPGTDSFQDEIGNPSSIGNFKNITITCESWGQTLLMFTKWIRRLSDEEKKGNLARSISVDDILLREPITGSVDNQPLSKEEITKIHQTLDQMMIEVLVMPEIDEISCKNLLDSLEYLKASAVKDGKKDWIFSLGRVAKFSTPEFTILENLNIFIQKAIAMIETLRQD